MAEGGVRKSSRIKSRGPMAYAEDDLDLAYDLHLDISNEISGVLKQSSKQKSISKVSARKNASAAMTSSQQKNKSKFGTGRKTASNLAKKVEKVYDSEEQEIKTGSETFKYVAKVPRGGDNSTNTGVECSNVPCSLCDTVFASEKAMKDHMAEIHGDEVELKGYLICDICSQMCVNQSVYDKHMQLHSNCRKFRCDICQKAFADSCSFKRHMKSHDDERPYTCDLCMKSFRDNPSLSRHQRTHTDRPRMFHCLKCDKDFTDKHTLKRHERTHMSVRPFECETCSKTFSEPGSFRRHLKIHSGVRSFVCPVCSRSFLEKQSLIRHQKNVCGFSDSASLPSFFNANTGQDDCDSDVNDSDMSRTTVDDKDCVLNESSSPDEFISAPKYRFSEVNELMLPSNSSKCEEHSEKSNGLVEPKDAPSLRSLVQKDPELYDSISEIVESIDSYEKMLDLCGDTGQVAIDAALTREPAPMPDNLLCFECGELLVNGENFRAQGKSFHPTLCNSYKCLNCDDVDYGEPPVLTAEMPEDGSVLPATENGVDSTADETLQTKQEKKLMPFRDSVSNNIFGTNEPHEHVRARLKSQHGGFLFEQMYSAYADSIDEEGGESDTNEQTDHASSAATSSRSHSLDSEVAHVSLGSQDGTSNHNPDRSLGGNTSSFGYSQQDHMLKNSPGRSAAPERQQACLSITPKMEYEADDQSIPSVFPCHLCTKVFASSAFLTRHLNLHKTSPHKCMVCSKTFTNSQNLKRHVTTHTGEKPYTCPYCRKRFRDPSNFSKHKRACCALQSTISPAASVVSKNCISSPQSLDDSGSMSQINATDLKQNLNFPSYSATIESSATQDLPERFNYYNDEEEDLPVSFGHPPDDADVSPAAKYPPDCSGKRGVSRDAYEAKEKLSPYKDGRSTEKKVDAGDLVISCDVCGKEFENDDLLAIHMKYHSSDPRVTCIECGKCFADPFGLKRHLRIHAGIRPHVCEYCGRGYCDNWSLRKHKSRGCMLHEVKVPADFLHPCLQCTRVFSESEFLDEHMNCHNGLLKFECDICQKGFSEAFNLKRHRRLHMAVCTSCDKEFQDVNSLNEHLAKECPFNIPQSATSKEIGFSCEECGRVYTTKSYLERHKKFHLDLKPYACEICSKRFSEAFRLRRHLKVHKGERPFSCETCLREFTDFSSLKRHLSNSSCSVPREPQDTQESEYFSCDLCDKFFTKNYLLARHMNVHSKERPFTCDECGRTYKDTSSLKRHQLIHQGIKSFICPVCGKDFFYSDSLKRHLTSSCGKKINPHRRRRGRGKGKRKSNNNINMRDRNTAGKNILVQDFDQQGMESERLSPSLLRNKSTSQDSSSGVKFGRWCCQRNNHCWRCSVKFGTATSFHKHLCVHSHKKPFHCPDCFFRSSRKMYLRLHRKTHKS